MTWSAKFRVQDIGEGPAPTNVVAVASVDDGTLITNTEKLRSLELRATLDVDETALAVGDELHAHGHFTA